MKSPIAQRIRFSILTGTALLALVACKSDDESARALLSDALQAYSAASDENNEPADRLASLEEVEALLSEISRDYATTDVGLQLAGQEAFGVLDPKTIPETKEEIGTLVAAENCVEFPTASCIFATISSKGMELPKPGDDLVRTVWGTLFSPDFDAYTFAATRAATDAAPYIAFMGIISGRSERAEDFFAVQSPDLPPKIAMTLALIEKMDRLVPSQSATHIVSAISAHVDSLGEHNQPAIFILSGLLNQTINLDELNTLWEAASQTHFEVNLPDWLYMREIVTNLDHLEYRSQVSDGLENFHEAELTLEQREIIGKISLLEGRDLVKGEQLWFAAQHSIADRLLETAESLEKPITFRGYFAETIGAMQLGYDGDLGTFNRIKALMPEAPKYLDVAYSFGRALTGDKDQLEALDVAEGILELAEALAGLEPKEIQKFFSYDIDPRLTYISQENLAKAHIFNFDFAGAENFTLNFEENLEFASIALKRSLKSGKINQSDVATIVGSIRTTEGREFVLSNLGNPSISLAIASELGVGATFYERLLADPEVQENTAKVLTTQTASH
ncbi:hypothetical protein [Phaeobacter inhibens]|uniref:hypothetical protein n=1 Tax=Phaeobacter inhibens TaxID=221822 RepID=UPI0012EC353B|nr:hypothetical protein [Phaeobacter inhibens]